MGMGGLNMPRLLPRERDEEHIVQEAGWDPMTGLDGRGKSHDPKDSRTLNRPVRNESLYRLS